MTTLNASMFTELADLLELNGATFEPASAKHLLANYSLSNTSVNVAFSGQRSALSLMFFPAIQIPPCARQDFTRFCFHHDDLRMMNLDLDENDGELKLHVIVPRVKSCIEKAIRENLALLDEVYPELLKYIAQSFQEVES